MPACHSRGKQSSVSDVLIALAQNPRQVLHTPSVTRSTTSANPVPVSRPDEGVSGRVFCIGGSRPRGRTSHTPVGHGIALKAKSQSRRRCIVLRPCGSDGLEILILATALVVPGITFHSGASTMSLVKKVVREQYLMYCHSPDFRA